MRKFFVNLKVTLPIYVQEDFEARSEQETIGLAHANTNPETLAAALKEHWDGDWDPEVIKTEVEEVDGPFEEKELLLSIM